MKSNVCLLTGRSGQLEAVLTEVEKCAMYNGLDNKSTLRVRLLAEELIEMLPALMKMADGKFWMENNGSEYELHVAVVARIHDLEARDKILSVSTSGKNTAAVGIMGKIRAAAEKMLLSSVDSEMVTDFSDFATMEPYTLSGAWGWSMREYADMVYGQERTPENEEAWDELEKSIIAKLADDVLVGVKGNRVDIVVRKTF